jgi:hypothetical protein
MGSDANPFGALSLIVAPAILTNACSVLVLSTSNRLARIVDRARELTRQLEGADDLHSPVGARRLHELSTAENRSLLLLRALSCCYVALSGFASATLLSLLGAVMVPVERTSLLQTFELLAIIAGLVAVGALVLASTVLVRETRLAVGALHDRAHGLRLRAAQGGAVSHDAVEPGDR